MRFFCVELKERGKIIHKVSGRAAFMDDINLVRPGMMGLKGPFGDKYKVWVRYPYLNLSVKILILAFSSLNPPLG